MKDQNKSQITNSEFQEGILLIGDQLQNNDQITATLKNAGHDKKVLPAALQKRSNPRLFIL